MRQRIEGLTGYYVVFGFGRVGREVVADLHDKGYDCVGTILTNPALDMRFASGDVLFALRTREQLGALNVAAGFQG